LALLSMVPKWNRHWLKTDPVAALEVEPPLDVVPPDELPPLPPVPPLDVVPPDEPPPWPAVPPPVAEETLAVLAAAPAEPPLPSEEDGTTLEPPTLDCPPWPLLPALDEAAVLAPPLALEALVVPPASPAWESSPLLQLQASRETAATSQKELRGVECASGYNRYIEFTLT
jgi:hypothetical protein